MMIHINSRPAAIRPLRVERLAEVLAVEFLAWIPKLNVDRYWDDQVISRSVGMFGSITVTIADNHFFGESFLSLI